jgi:hypothetical protein
MARETPPPLRSALPIHILGAIVVWGLILVTPGLGDAVTMFTYFFHGQSDDVWLSDSIRTPLFASLWQTLGYQFDIIPYCPFLGGSSSDIATLIFLFTGIGIGLVGAGFQAAAIKWQFGAVSRTTVNWLCLIWGSVVGVLSLGAVQTVWIMSGQGCLADNSILALFEFACSLIVVFFFPMCTMLVFARRLTAKLRDSEAMKHLPDGQSQAQNTESRANVSLFEFIKRR